MNVRELVQRAIENHEGLSPVPFSNDMPDSDAYLATPDRVAYVLGWIVANAIVNARFADSGIDVLPVFSPDSGWDRFLITRKTTADEFKAESANRFGMIMLTGEDAPIITRASGETRLALGTMLREDPETSARRGGRAVSSSCVAETRPRQALEGSPDELPGALLDGNRDDRQPPWHDRRSGDLRR